ncbi:hypothetical protein C8A05DRAFT_41865 [Staphylotrichum tortipilum]|uniref:MARVEL domain-containing protein n=1 Tax=Staphylotrichum tortipilum TaxID=2831512 RepID=A0AAN6MRJ6_9PEZI|nr:hypothetical protein C8A05DRAFT_41865 [Staphylotrichum longicolle]
MADAVPQQVYAAPSIAVQHPPKEQYIQQTPVWVVIVRGLQIFFSIIILGMAGYLIHGHAMAANGFAVVCTIFTWIVVAYVLISEKMTSAQNLYNIWAVLSLDLLMVIFWLASLGANAALRASFTETVTVTGCYSDGSAVSAHYCNVAKRAAIEKRAAVAGPVGLAVMSAIAGVSALNWLLFLATLIFHGHTYRLWHQEHKSSTSPSDPATVEMKAQGTPMLAAQELQAPAPHPQYNDTAYQSQVYPQQQQAAYPPQDAYAQQAAAAYAAQQPTPPPGAQYGGYADPSQGYAQGGYVSPQGTPAPGQGYYPPGQQPAQLPGH